MKNASPSVEKTPDAYDGMQPYCIAVVDPSNPNRLEKFTAVTFCHTPEDAIRRCKRFWADTRREQLVALPVTHKYASALFAQEGTSAVTEVARYARLEADAIVRRAMSLSRARRRKKTDRVAVTEAPALPAATGPAPDGINVTREVIDPFTKKRSHKGRKAAAESDTVVKPGVNDQATKAGERSLLEELAEGFRRLRSDLDTLKAGEGRASDVAESELADLDRAPVPAPAKPKTKSEVPQGARRQPPKKQGRPKKAKRRA